MLIESCRFINSKWYNIHILIIIIIIIGGFVMWKDTLLSLKETILCGILLLLGAILNNNVLLILAIAIGGYNQTKEGITDTIQNKHLNVELLMILSAIGACLIGYYMEGAVLIFIFSLSGALEELTLDRSQREIRSLMELQPTEATRLNKNGSTEVVSVESLQIGDKVIVAVGETVPIDAMIYKGQSSIEEAAITGESMPKEKGVGDSVFGGTMNISHPITIEVNTLVNDTLIQKIVKMVEEAQQYPSKTARFIERIEDYYARIVLVVVLLVVLIPIITMGQSFETAFYRGMILLVVASPCALIASVTPATLSAISNGAKRGILVKGGIHFENMMDAKAVAFDKTGTLTQGVPSLTNMFYIDDVDAREVGEAVIAIEQYSTHPLASAVVSGLYKNLNIEDYPSANNVEEIAGFGIKGVYAGKEYRIGKFEHMISEDQIVTDKGLEFAESGNSLVYIQQDDDVIGVLGLTDVIRPEALSLVHWLNKNNIKTVMITGDNKKTAEHIGSQIGVSKIVAECLPDEKATIIRDLEREYGTVVMIGDGINDAPALANATIGIAMGSGTDIAMEAADIILVKDDIHGIQYAIELSLKLRKIVIQNVSFSIGVILLLVISNFFDRISLPLGVVGHEGSTILVILNSLRLLKEIKIER
ncbi:cadmium-translocating P-type ATPase [Erysipelothrix rhusiopathiae]|nr:cadmium-translocating P-type ATPase [Erysipelothrix rhusiopathiae]MDV7679010.1 cadmium-translocating P-type ATPase [Erysipelothrix rhusiopathiae]MDV7682465.1 cadmium-translocating P-type ATPase [Erysipelothrix rhusiopathiae]MDV7684139.1 cadmium-translocating P-type ATPase [Erysipelothrix rhusiopathiae]MDV7685904.1 cadmium-translocating P-type ATPase [Erysipelothrix rhusiopathiae]